MKFLFSLFLVILFPCLSVAAPFDSFSEQESEWVPPQLITVRGKMVVAYAIGGETTGMAIKTKTNLGDGTSIERKLEVDPGAFKSFLQKLLGTNTEVELTVSRKMRKGEERGYYTVYKVEGMKVIKGFSTEPLN